MQATAKIIYQRQINTSKKRGIGFYFSLDEWVSVWETALGPYWKEKRGRGKEQYCMARIGDQGDYRPENVKIVTNAQNRKEKGKIPRNGAATIPCPECDGITRALKTRRLKNQLIIKRIRRCVNCEFTFLTHECKI